MSGGRLQTSLRMRNYQWLQSQGEPHMLQEPYQALTVRAKKGLLVGLGRQRKNNHCKNDPRVFFATKRNTLGVGGDFTRTLSQLRKRPASHFSFFQSFYTIKKVEQTNKHPFSIVETFVKVIVQRHMSTISLILDHKVIKYFSSLIPYHHTKRNVSEGAQEKTILENRYIKTSKSRTEIQMRKVEKFEVFGTYTSSKH